MAKKSHLKIIPLGGLGEIGKNMLVIEFDQDMLLIDAGLMFPEEEMLGIDLVLPDFSYVVENKNRLKAIIITHGHEDHIGALPYLLKKVEAPVYGTRLTLGLIKEKLAEYGLAKVKLEKISAGRPLNINCFKLEFVQVNHSIPDGVGLAIHTPVGLIVHSGDFKFDQTPINGKVTDYTKFSTFGRQNVLVLLSDSTNAEVPGFTPSEREVGRALIDIFELAKQRIIVASFASHIHRLQQVVNVTAQTNRKLAICGRTMIEIVGVATELGYLFIPKEMLIDVTEVSNYPPEEVVILSTGSQGEPLSALTKMASHDHRFVKIVPGDTVIISARPVPGNEKSVSRTIDQLFRRGANVYYKPVHDVHVSGHGAQEELKTMINLIKPRYFIPIHGEYRHLTYHAELARSLGIPDENIIVAENGTVIEFTDSKYSFKGKIPAGVVFVDGLGVGDIGDIVLRDRKHLSSDGILIVIVTINQQNGQLVSRPELISRGFVYVRGATELLEEAREKVETKLAKTAREEITDWSILKLEVKNSISHFIYERTKRRPMILPIIVEV